MALRRCDGSGIDRGGGARRGNGSGGCDGGFGLGLAQMDAFLLGMGFLSALALDMGGPLLALSATMLALGYRTAFLGHKGELSV